VAVVVEPIEEVLPDRFITITPEDIRLPRGGGREEGGREGGRKGRRVDDAGVRV